MKGQQGLFLWGRVHVAIIEILVELSRITYISIGTI